MSARTGLPVGSVALVHDSSSFPNPYQRLPSGHWFHGSERYSDEGLARFIEDGHAEVVYRASDPDEGLAEFLWELFEVPNGAESWALALDTAQRNQVECAKQVREFVKRQEEEGK